MVSVFTFVLICVIVCHSVQAFLPGLSLARTAIRGTKLAMTHSSEKWELNTITKDSLTRVVSEAIAKQVMIDNFKVDDVKLDVNLASEYELDSVDVVAVMLYLETHFSKEIKKAGVKIPVHKVEKVQTGQDLFNVMVEVLKGIEDKDGSIGSNGTGNSAAK